MPTRPGQGGIFWAVIGCFCAAVAFAEAGTRKTRAGIVPQIPPPTESVLLMEADTRTILFEKDSRKPRPPASMVKMMLTLIVMEKIRAGDLHLSDPVTASALASQMGGSQIYLRQGEILTLEEMMKSIVIASANDASAAVAEHIAGTIGGFVELMNERATALQMADTRFETVHGLPPSNGSPGDLASAYDLAILASELSKYPEILSWGTIREDSLRGGKFTLTNTNKLIYNFPGSDGFKTGFHREAGFNVTATAQRDGLRMIAVVMGAPTSHARFDEARRLLSLGFNGYRKMVIVRKDSPIGPDIYVSGSTVRRFRAVAQEDLTIVVKKGSEDQLVTVVDVPDSITAPIHRGQAVGQVQVKQQDQVLMGTAAVVPEEIPYVGLIWRLLKY